MNCLRGEPVDRLPFIEVHGYPWCFSYVQRWDLQGLPVGPEPRLAFGFDGADVPAAVGGFETVPVDWDMVPRYPVHEIPFDGEYVRYLDPRCGRIKKEIPSPDPEHPMQTRVVEGPPLVQMWDDWLEYRKRYRPTPAGRYGEDWEEWVEHAETSAHPVVLRLSGLTGPVRGAIGTENETGMFFSFYERPSFVHELAEYFAEFVIAVGDKALLEAKVDCVILGDQIAGDEGPFMSPEQMEEFFLPGYRRIIDHARGRGIDTVVYQADGNVLPFVPMLVDAGVNGFMGIPRQMNMAGLKARYGNDICMIGGIDRWVLPRSNEEIEREVGEKMALAAEGRIVPCLCGGVLPETPLENYRHYAEYLKKHIWEGSPAPS